MAVTGTRLFKPNGVQANTLHYIKRCVDRAFMRMYTRHQKREMAKVIRHYYVESDPQVAAISKVFSYLSTKRYAPGNLNDLPSEMRILLRDMAAELYTGEERRFEFERNLLQELHANADTYELLSQVPRERKTRVAKQRPATRAEATGMKIQEWERKLKYAKTRLAKLRRRQKYYITKGK